MTTMLQDDPIVEYEDEFGRMRTARKSEVPRNLIPSADAEEEEIECVGCYILPFIETQHLFTVHSYCVCAYMPSFTSY